MKRRVFVMALAILCMTAVVAAQAKIDLLKRITLDMNAAPPQGVFEFLARSLGCDVTLDPKVQQLVTIRMENVTARTAMDAICESIGCRWRLDASKLIVDPSGGVRDATDTSQKYKVITIERLRKPLPEGTRFENASLNTVLAAVSAATGLEIQLEGIDSGKNLTLDLSGQPLIDAIKRVATEAGIKDAILIGGIDEAKDKKFKLYVSPGGLKAIKAKNF